MITDMTMPGMTGDILLQKIKKVNPDLSVIICTGFSENLSRERAVAIGADALLMKPIVTSEIASTIRDVLDGQV